MPGARQEVGGGDRPRDASQRRRPGRGPGSREWEGGRQARRGAGRGDDGDVLDDGASAMFPDDAGEDQKARIAADQGAGRPSVALAERWTRCAARGTTAGAQTRPCPRCAASIARRGSWRCSAGSNRSPPASARSPALAPRRRPDRPRAARTPARGLDAQRRARHERLDDRRDPAALGAIADFCDAVAVDQVRLVQCDAGGDLRRVPDARRAGRAPSHRLRRQRPSPALSHLADDPHVARGVVVTDGDIDYPREHALRRAVGLPRERAPRLFRRTAASSRWTPGEGIAMKVIQELVAYFDRRGRLPRSRSGMLDQGYARRRCAAHHARPLRAGRRDVLLPAHRAAGRAALGHGRLHGRFRARGRRRPCRPCQDW